MAFNIILQKNDSERNKMDKNVTDLATLTGTLKGDTSIIDPVILIESDIATMRQCNYLHIYQFGREYFVNNIKSVRNNLFELTCHVDVLASYKSQIRHCGAIIKRSQKNYNLYLDDGSLKVYNNPKIKIQAFSGAGFSTQEFVLAVAGA